MNNELERRGTKASCPKLSLTVVCDNWHFSDILCFDYYERPG
jgi:hypothetical protein